MHTVGAGSDAVRDVGESRSGSSALVGASDIGRERERSDVGMTAVGAGSAEGRG